MKVVSYNIHDSYAWKIERLLGLNADILVVPEITCPEDARLPGEYEIKWNGISYYWKFRRWKGLGVIWRRGVGYIPDWYNPSLYYAIPLIVGDLLILAIWPTKRKGVTDNKLYPQIAQEIIGEYAPYFMQYRTVVIGDFNCYVNQVDSSEQFGDIRRIDAMLSSYGLHSVYHEWTGERLGEETCPTYFHHFEPQHPFFLDYAYTNIPVQSFRLFSWDSEMSDHVGMELII